MSTENLKVVMTADASGLDKASTKAQQALDKISKSAAEWDKRARELNIQNRYTNRSISSLGEKAAQIAPKIENNAKGFARLGTAGKQANFAMVSLGQGIGDLPYGFAAVANNVQQVTQAFALVQRESGGTAGALKSLLGALKGPTGIFVAVSIVSAAITYFSRRLKGASGAAKSLIDPLKTLHDEFSKSQGDINGQIAKLQALTKAYFANKGNLQAQANIKAELNKINKAYTSQLGVEIKSYKDANTQLKQYQNYLVQTALIKAQSDQISKIVTAANEKATKKAIEFAKKLTEAQKELAEATAASQRHVAPGQLSLSGTNLSAAALKVQKIKDEFEAFKQTLSSDTFRQLKPLFEQIYDSTQKLAGITNPFKEIKDGADQAIQSINKLSGKFKEILPSLPGLGVNAGSIQNPGVSTQINPAAPPIPIDHEKLDPIKQEELDKLIGATRIAYGLSDAFDSVFEAMLKGDNVFQALVGSVEQLIAQLVMAIVKAELLKVITQAVGNGGDSGGGGGFGGLLGGLLSALASLFPFFANGGYVQGPQLAVVGDAPGGEWILNQRQMSAILNGNAGSREVKVTGEFSLRGNDLRAAIKRADDANSRVN